MVFEKLENIVEIEVEYLNKSTLAIQSGREPALSAVDQPVLKIGGEPAIPGSSIKGALRSILEALLSQNGKKVCVPEATIPIKERDKKGYAYKIGRLPPCDPKNEICSICQIFGAAGLSGRAIFLDAHVNGEYNLIERTHVAISRENRSATEGTLMKIQAIDAGAKFNGTIRIINPEDWQVGALLSALENLKYLGFGSKKTSGYGEIEVKVNQITVKKMENGKWIKKEVDIKDFKASYEKLG